MKVQQYVDGSPSVNEKGDWKVSDLVLCLGLWILDMDQTSRRGMNLEVPNISKRLIEVTVSWF
ncbi:MAG: hypothetical protein Q4G61_00945 [Tissierellia bacterium]|nr:hypothetical protein [Tissierellia bacterium]